MNQKNSSKELLKNYASKFSHIYVEKDVKYNKNTINILNKFKDSKVVYIDNYKDVFNRPRQNFNIQKKSQNIIIAKKRGQILYKGSNLCEDFNQKNFYYCSNILNCIYNCEYCYLKGLYQSSNIVIFVNIEDFFGEVRRVSLNENVYLCISYDSDLLAFEDITHFVAKWINFARENPNVLIEIKTKSNNFKSVCNEDIPDNVIFAWTLSPNEVIYKYEKGAPSLEARLKSVKMAINKGIKLRISIEPIMKIDNFEYVYFNFVNTIFKYIKSDNLRDVNLGVFRMSEEHIKNIRKMDKYCSIFGYNLIKQKQMRTYEDSEYMVKYVCNQVEKYVDSSKIYVYR